MHIRKTKKYSRTSLPARYIPKQLSSKDKKRQLGMLLKSRKLYKSNKYYTRKNVSSFKSKKSSHIENAKRIYNIDNVTPSNELARKTGCSLGALKKIVRKGEGAFVVLINIYIYILIIIIKYNYFVHLHKYHVFIATPC